MIATTAIGAKGIAVDPKIIGELGRRAETTVWKGFSVVWQARLRADMADTTRDSLKTGMIGIEYTPLTTTLGVETAKELSTCPGWASWIVAELISRGIKAGDKVAVAMTGSFPGLNLALLAALQELDVEVTGISSVGASSWGANEPGFTWPEIESMLHREGVLRVGCGAITFGGTGDRGLEWKETETALAAEVVRKSGLPLIKPRNLRDAVDRRLMFYGKVKHYKAFINVGGSSATLGGGAKMRFVRGGWFEEPLGLKGSPDGVMDAFLKAGVPCLNLLYLDDLNRRAGIIKQ
jgi:poly-gamma-glutamate system protein